MGVLHTDGQTEKVAPAGRLWLRRIVIAKEGAVHLSLGGCRPGSPFGGVPGR